MASEKQGFGQEPPSYEMATSQYPNKQPGAYPIPAAQYPNQQPYPSPWQPPCNASGQAQFIPNHQPGQPYATQLIVVQPRQGVIMARPTPPDYMIPSVVACFCCFWPTALCAIYYASRAQSLAAEGDMVMATRMSNNSRTLMITSVVIGVCWILLFVILRVVLSSANTYTDQNDYSY